jgi:hypothetical protein
MTKRTILRFAHLLVSIPILGCVYGPPEQIQQYLFAARWFFIPTVVFAGYWMFSGITFAAIGVALWLGVYQFFGYGAVIVTQMALFMARKVWLLTLKRRAQSEGTEITGVNI